MDADPDDIASVSKTFHQLIGSGTVDRLKGIIVIPRGSGYELKVSLNVQGDSRLRHMSDTVSSANNAALLVDLLAREHELRNPRDDKEMARWRSYAFDFSLYRRGFSVRYGC